MKIIEAAIGITGKLATGFRDLTRGYSDDELARQLRIFRGEITPDDRSDFKSKEEGRLFLLSSNYLYRPLNAIDFPEPPTIANFLGLRAPKDLPDSEINLLLMGGARDKLLLLLWHQLPRTPKIRKS